MQVGDLCVVKDQVWRKWCLQHQREYAPFKAQPVVGLLAPDGYYVMLAYPFYWWEPADLELV